MWRGAKPLQKVGDIMLKKAKMAKNKTFHRNLKRLRKNHGLSLGQLAHETGIPIQRMELWEYFGVEPSAFYVARLANYFDVSKEVLTGR